MIFIFYYYNSVSSSYSSYFGSNALNIIDQYTKYDSNFSYLLLNSEFEMDSVLNGFIINAFKPGNVNLSVSFYFKILNLLF